MDRKSVMAWLDGLAQDDWRMYHSDSEVQEIARSALALLKEDCHNCKLECMLQKYDQLKEKYDKLLKEQETVEPINAFKRVNGTTAYSCPRCAALIVDGSYCKHCGQAVKWE